MSLLKRYWGFLGAALVALGLIIQLIFFRNSPVTRSPSLEIRNQFSHDIHQSLQTLHSSRTYRDWRSSGYTATDVINNVLALNNNDAFLHLCSALSELSPEQLGPFEQALARHPARKQLPCAEALLSKVAKFWASQTQAVDAARAPGSPETIATGTREVSAQSIRSITSDLLKDGEYTLVFRGNIQPLITREILKSLDERDIRAIFLIPGNSAREHADIVALMTRLGDTVGSESAEAQEMTLMPTSTAATSLSEGKYSVELAGHVPKAALFSFPFGAANPALRSIAAKQGLKEVVPSIHSDDWKTFEATRLIQLDQKKIQSSSKGIILFHNLRQTAIALPAILDELSSAHKRVVTFELK